MNATADATTRGMNWQSAATLLSQVLQAASTLTVAAFTGPEEFALWGLAAILFNAQHLVGSLGFGPALIYFRDEDRFPDAVDGAVVVATGLALVFGAAAFLLAPTLAGILGEGFSRADVVAVIRIMSLVFVASTAAQLPQALIEKSLDFRRRAIPEISASLVYASLAIGLAVAGLGVWSLIFARTLQSILLLAAFWAAAPVRPRFPPRVRLDVLAQLFRFGRFIAASAVFGVIFGNADTFLIGVLSGAAAMGAYALAYSVATLVPTFLSLTMGKVFFAIYAAVRDDAVALRDAFATAAHYLAITILPTTAGIAFLAPDLLVEIFGDRWIAVQAFLPILALYGMARVLTLAANTFLAATGTPQALLWLEAIALGGAGLLIWPLAGSGETGVAWAFTLGQTAAATVGLVLTRSAWTASLLRRIGPAAAATLLATAAATLIGQFPLGRPGAWVRLAVFGICYAGSLIVTDRRIGRLAGTLSRRAAPAGQGLGPSG